MATTMNRLNVTILDGNDQLTHWVGSPSVEGGELKGINESGVGGPPVWAYDETGNDRDRYTFPIETKILGADESAQNAFIAKYALGTRFNSPTISGLPADLDWIVTKANVKHDADGENPSILSITLSEVGPTA